MNMDTTRDSLLYVVDCQEDELHKLIGAISDGVRARMLREPSNYVGVLFYNVAETANSIRIVLPLKQQGSAEVKSLLRLYSDANYRDSQLKPLPKTETCALGAVFSAVGTQFDGDTTRAWRRAVWITGNARPHDRQSREASVARTKARDLIDKNILVLCAFTENVDIKLFWEDFPIKPVPIAKTSMLADLAAMERSRRPKFQAQLHLGPVDIDVRGYSIYSKDKLHPPVYIWSEKDRQELTETKTVYIVERTAREIERQEIQRAFRFGEELVPVSQEQLLELRDFGPPSLTVLGFVRADHLGIGRRQASYFLYPHDKHRQGSVRAFIALWRSMQRVNRAAVVRAVLQRQSAPVLALAYAANDRVQGLHLLILPALDDLRDLPKDLKNGTASDELADLATNIIESLRMRSGFDVCRYSNPQLEWTRAVIESQALSLETPQLARDTTVPKYRSIEARSGTAIRAFNKKLGHSEVEDAEAERGGMKKETKPAKKQRKLADTFE